MKRNLLILMTMLFISHNVIAEERSGFYLKGAIGANKLNNTKETANNPDVDRSAYLDGTSLKSKSKFSPNYSIGIGYYINDIFRTDLSLDYSKIKFNKATGRIKFLTEDGDNILLRNTLNRKASIYSFMINNYADFTILDKVKLFLGGGIGVAQIKEKGGIDTDIEVNNNSHFKENSYVSTKRKNNFAYSLTLGTAIQLTESTNLELAYSWKDYGKTKPKIDSDGEPTHDKNHYRGHHVGVGIRFDI